MREVLARSVAAAAAVVWLWLSGTLPAAGAQPQPASPLASSASVVLDKYGLWRIHCELSPPTLPTGEPVKLKHQWLNYQTAPAAQNWMEPEFDDAAWFKGPATLATKTALAARICLRGKFTVTDPAAVEGLALRANYRGGLIVYINGKELKREHIADGAALAEGPVGEERSLEALAIPSDLLRKGLNVVAIEVVRSPVPEPAGYYADNSCEILGVRVSAPTSAGLIPNAVRPQGFQVWNADSMAVDLNVDWGDRCEPLRPVKIVGARNGLFTGKVIAGSTDPIRGLKVTPCDLRHSVGGGVISAARISVRYGIPWNELMYADPMPPYPTYANRLGALAETAPAEVAIMKPFRQFWQDYLRFPPEPDKIKPVDGAVAPIWVTVDVPADAAAGEYCGSMTVQAEGEKTVDVPIELNVVDWLMPGTQDYRTWVDVVQCPDTLALEYGVPLWSEKHWEMIANSFKLIGQTGSRILYVPLISHTNLGNEESMVRWVKTGEGRYDYDFSVLDRYLDVAEKNMGRPKVIVLVLWEIYMVQKEGDAEAVTRSRLKEVQDNLTKLGVTLGHGPLVTVLDRATGRTENVTLPPYVDTEASRPLWKPLIDQLRARLRNRGLEDTMMVGLQGDAWATKKEHELFNELTGGAPWVLQSHEGFGGYSSGREDAKSKLMYGISKIGYQARVWAVSYSDDNADRGPGYRGGIQSHRGWDRPDLVAGYDRGETRLQAHSNSKWRYFAEVQITGGQRGPGRIGGEYWKVLRDKKGQRASKTYERYPESNWRLLVIPTSLLAPGPDGPVATDLMEALRQGVQECEARIVIERALYDETLKRKLGPDLAKRCEDYLYARHMMMWLTLASQELHGDKQKPADWRCGWRWVANEWGNSWFLGSNWQQRTADLFSLAGEVNGKLGTQP